MSKKSSTKEKSEQIEAKISDMKFLGDLEGNGVSALRFKVGKLLQTFSLVNNAYFSKLKYKGEDKYRIALIIQTSEPCDKLGKEIAAQCAEISPMDIMFSNSCADTFLQKVKNSSEPLFSDTNLLFECPVVVSRGTNTEMPEQWKGAILNYCVAAKDYEAALFKAINDLKFEGYKFENVYNARVAQLDPSVWWEQYVLEKWPGYLDYFPSQQDIEIMLITGGLHKGPTLGWENEPDNT